MSLSLPVAARRIALGLEQIEAYCHRNQIRWMALFGSVLREDFGAGSDVDVLAEFEPEAKVGLFALARMGRELGEMMGRRVDLLTPGFLSRHFRQQVLEGAVTIYEARP